MQPVILPPWLRLYKEDDNTVQALVAYWGNITSEVEHMFGTITWITLSNGMHYEVGKDKVIKIEAYDNELQEVMKFGWDMRTAEKEATYLITFKRTKPSGE